MNGKGKRFGRFYISYAEMQMFNGFGIEFGFLDLPTDMEEGLVETFSLSIKLFHIIVAVGFIYS